MRAIKKKLHIGDQRGIASGAHVKCRSGAIPFQPQLAQAKLGKIQGLPPSLVLRVGGIVLVK